MLLRIVSLCLCLALAGASVEDDWSESTDSIDLPEVVMAELPLSTHSKSPAGHLLAFDADKYDYLKMIATEADELKFDSFVQIPGAANAKLHLKKLEVFTEDAELTTVNEDGVEETMERPEVLHMHGTVDGDENSRVLLNLSPHGTTGFIHTSDEKFLVEMLHNHQAHAVVTTSADEPSDDEKKAMAANAATDTLAAPAGAGAFEGDGQPDSDPDNLMLVDAGKTDDGILEIAIECDKKCKDLLASKGGSETYLASVIAGVSKIYLGDLGRSMKISKFRNWAGVSPFDRGTASLSELVNYYKSNMYGKEQYDVGHLFTGIREGGLAYVGTVCAGSRGVNTGVSSIQGTWKSENGYKSKSSYNWDLIVSAHELGHNMGSGHSHDYGGPEGPIDECVACAAGTTGSCGGSAARPVSRTDKRCVVGTIMSYCHLCGGTANVKMEFHPRAITKIKANLDSRCGTVSGGGTNTAPVPAPTPAPTVGYTGSSGSSDSCTAKASLGKCEKCQTTDQCQGNSANGGTWYCCPYMKKCVEKSTMPCYMPIANCRPMCYDSKVSTCVCGGNQFSTMGWGKPTCSGSSGGSSGGGSNPSPPTQKPTKSPITTTDAKDTQSWCPRYAKYCSYQMTVGRGGPNEKTQAMTIWCPKTCGAAGL